MVGVPGRSRSCGTCRKRKKGGCDMKRPACGSCLRLGLKCEGYEHESIFINNNIITIHARNRRPANKPPPQVTLPDTLARSAYEGKYIGSFWGTYLPESKEFPPHATRYANGVWTNALHQLSHSSPAIRKILLALSLSMIGREENKSWEKEEGLRCYVSSLGDMSAALSNPKRENPTSLCVTSRLCGLYEVLFGQDEQDKVAQARNWRKHINGELAIMTSQSPEKYVSGYLHQLFVDGRFHLTTAAVQTRKKTILSRPEWKTIPWRKIPKTPKDLLIDIFVEMPTLLEDLDAARACQDLESREILQSELVQRCWDFEKELFNWRTGLGIPDPTYKLNVDQLSFSLDILLAANIMCLYWAICILVYSTLQIASDPQTILPRHTDPRLYARRIAEALLLLLHSNSGAFGVHLANFPVAVALVYLDKADGDAASEERNMILDVFRKSGHGKTVDRFSASLKRQNARSPQLAMMDGPDASRTQARSWFGVDGSKTCQ